MSPASFPAPDLTGRVIGHYRILGLLGRGGMGQVYRAEDVRLGRHVALKLLPEHLSDDPHANERLRVEARAASALDDPHICTIHEVGEDAGRLFIAMACYEGQTLAEALAERGPLPVEEAVAIARQVASGLAAAHRKGIVHRDLKPSNIFLCTDEDSHGPRAKVLDFGVAKVQGVNLTQTGSTVGTIAYAAPEQARGERVDGRADLWALGVVLYEMVTGRRPFAATYDAALLHTIQFEEPQPLRRYRPEVPEAVEAVVMRLLEKRPEDRFQHAEAVDTALVGAIRGPAPRLVPRRLPRKALARIGGGMAAFMLALAAVVWISVQPGGSDIPQEMHLAVYPFFANDPLVRPVSDALTNDLVDGLAGLDQYRAVLRVLPMGGAFVGEDAIAEAKGRGSNLALTGRVQGGSTHLSISLTLYNVATSGVLRTGHVEARSSEPDLLRGEVLVAVERMLGLRPSQRERRAFGGSVVQAAYDDYSRGERLLEDADDADRLDDAAGYFRRAISTDSSYALAYARLGETYLRLYEEVYDATWVRRAKPLAVRALALDPNEPRAHITLALLYNRETNQTQAAVREARRALTLDPGAPDARLALAGAYEGMGRLAIAEEEYRRVTDQHPDYWRGFEELGAFYWKRSNLDAAVQQFQRLVQLRRDRPSPYASLGGLYSAMGRLSEARDMLEQSIQRQPTPGAYVNLAYLYYRQKNFAGAARTYRDLLLLDSTESDVWGNLGSALERLNAPRDSVDRVFRSAIRWAEALRATSPADKENLSYLATYYVNVGELEAGRAAIKEATGSPTENSDVAFNACLVYEQLGDRARALEWLGRALRLGYDPAMIEDEPKLDDLRHSPRYAELAQASE